MAPRGVTPSLPQRSAPGCGAVVCARVGAAPSASSALAPGTVATDAPSRPEAGEDGVRGQLGRAAGAAAGPDAADALRPRGARPRAHHALLAEGHPDGHQTPARVRPVSALPTRRAVPVTLVSWRPGWGRVPWSLRVARRCAGPRSAAGGGQRARRPTPSGPTSCDVRGTEAGRGSRLRHLPLPRDPEL